MYRLVLLAVALPLVACQSAPATASPLPDDSVTRTTLLVGTRQLAEEVWAPVEDPFLVGAEYSSISSASNFGPEVGFSGSISHDFPDFIAINSKVLELYAGGRFQKATGDTRPFVGAGVALTYAEIEALLGSAGSIDDTVFGGYVHAGFSVRATETMEIVFDVRKRFGSDADFSGIEADLDYLTFAIGFSF